MGHKVTLSSKGELSQHAMDLFESMQETASTKDSEEFNRFWLSIPASDAFLNYPPTRFFKRDKPKVKAAFNRAVATTEPDFIIKAMKSDVATRMALSSRENNLSFMKSPARWLDDCEFNNIPEWEEEEQHGTAIE
jgi:NAD-dependent oxidoreductase involved in siderophore biosynthesis